MIQKVDVYLEDTFLGTYYVDDAEGFPEELAQQEVVKNLSYDIDVDDEF